MPVHGGVIKEAMRKQGNGLAIRGTRGHACPHRRGDLDRFHRQGALAQLQAPSAEHGNPLVIHSDRRLPAHPGGAGADSLGLTW